MSFLKPRRCSLCAMSFLTTRMCEEGAGLGRAREQPLPSCSPPGHLLCWERPPRARWWAGVPAAPGGQGRATGPLPTQRVPSEHWRRSSPASGRQRGVHHCNLARRPAEPFSGHAEGHAESRVQRGLPTVHAWKGPSARPVQTWRGSEPGAVPLAGRCWGSGRTAPPVPNAFEDQAGAPRPALCGALPGARGPREMKGTGSICFLTFFLTPTGTGHRFPAHSRRTAIPE